LEWLNIHDFEKNTPGPKTFDSTLVNLMRNNRRSWGEQELFYELGIRNDDVRRIRALNNQLRHLEEFKLIELKNRRWRWVE